MGRHGAFSLVMTAAVVLATAACGGAGTSTPAQGVPVTTPTNVSVTISPPTGSPLSRLPATTPSASLPPGTSSVDPGEPDVGPSEPAQTPTQPAGGGDSLDALAPFFAAVADTDQKLEAAAEAINAGIRSDTVTFDQATIDTIDRASPFAAAAAIPTGLDPGVEQAVLLVYSDLVSRYGAMRGGDCVQVGTRPLADLNADCFVRGHEPSSRMPGDVSGVQAAATAAPTMVIPDPESRESAEVLLRIEFINKANMGCGTMGGYLATEAIPVVWVTDDSGAPEVPPTDGRVGGVGFTASYDAGSGWTVDLRAC